jgi:hypothetical protein
MAFTSLSREKHQLILELAAKDPQRSAHSIGIEVGVDKTTVSKYRNLPLPGIEPSNDNQKIFTLRRQLDTAERRVAQLIQELEEAAPLRSFFSSLVDARPQPPAWLVRTRDPRKRQSIATVVLSDTHFDEVVRPEQVGYVNEYSREIAERRLENFFQNTIEVANDFISGIKYEGLVLALDGDIFSGDIHEELKETNAARLYESLLYWIDPMISGIKLLADAFGRIYVPAVPGNHGRRSRKPVAKFRAQDNLDWLFSKLLQKFLAHDKRITFDVADGADLNYTIFGTRYQATHGDQFKGGSGISGLLAPMMLGDHRKRKRQQAIQQPYDVMHMGHWHQLKFLGGVVINGSLKGYDEYAMISNFDYEDPKQAFWITDVKHGMTLQAPILVRDKTERFYPGAPETAQTGTGRVFGQI